MQRRTRRTGAPLTKQRIVQAALELIDHEGIGALSMRRLGSALGIEAMSLYHHFPSRESLIEAVLAAASPHDLPAATGRWRDDSVALAEAVYARLAAHPKVLPLRWDRRRSPHARSVLDAELRIFQSAGYDEALARDAHRLLGSYIVGCVIVELEAARRIPAAVMRAQFRIGLEMLLDGIAARHLRNARPKLEPDQSRSRGRATAAATKG